MIVSATLLIIGLTALVSYEGIKRPYWREGFLFNPFEISKGNHLWGLITHSWFHADYQHLLFNMFSLFMLGGCLEQSWSLSFGDSKGMVMYVTLYLVGGLAATMIPYVRHRYNSGYRSLGASGAVSAVVFAMILWEPELPLGLLFIPIPIPAYIFGPLYLLFEYLAMKRGNTGIANDGHISGALFGILFVLLLAPNKAIDFIHIFLS
jgi:membrane associated rhomboid family serine protease